ncbi:hypothetical protein ASG65_19820 [Bacillus sp. Leaf13]|nr:hypothetical protein ASG65_19820 [Bacillus sp. Leaf13]
MVRRSTMKSEATFKVNVLVEAVSIMLHSAWIMKKNGVSGLKKSTTSDTLTQIRRPLLFPFPLLQGTEWYLV